MSAVSSVLVVEPRATRVIDLPASRTLVVGQRTDCGVVLDDARVAPRHLTLTAREDGVHVEELRGATGTRLNDIPLSGQAVLRAGDELTLGSIRLVVMEAREPVGAARLRLASHDELSSRLEGELLRAGDSRPVAWVMVALPPLNTPARQALLRRLFEETALHQAAACWGEFSGDVLAAVVPELESAALKAFLKKLPETAGPRAKVAAAVFPEDGAEAEALLECALHRLFALDEGADDFVWSDPVMVRLNGVLEGVDGLVVVEGARGSGRSSLLRWWKSGLRVIDARAVGAAVPGSDSILVQNAGRLSATQVDWLRASGRWAGATVAVGELPSVSAHRVRVPELKDRPLDITALAEHFLSRFRQRLGRPKLTLGSDARSILLRYRWPGQVRELKNVLARAARASIRDEVGHDALPSKLLSDAPAENLRGALKATERELLLEALARTRWNVTAAATRLGLPRRTVVYRMGKLGLKRPAR